MSHWAIVVPCLMYLTSVGRSHIFREKPSANIADAALGIALVHNETLQLYSVPGSTGLDIAAPCYSVSVSPNVLLTLMIVVRLALHSRNFRNATGGPVGTYKAIITMFIESCALYAVTFLLFIGVWGPSNPLQLPIFPILAATQVRIVFNMFSAHRNLRTL